MNPTTPQQIGAPRAGSGHKGKRIDLVKLAISHRQLFWLVLFRLVVEIVGLVVYGNSLHFTNTEEAVRVGVYMVLSFALAAIFTVLMWRMAIALGEHPALGVACAVMTSLPCAGPILLLLLNQHLTDVLKAAGCKVGLMGVSATEMHKLRLGVCSGCGYDLRGLSGSACPECGTALAPPT